MAWYNTYRPTSFADVVGQSLVKKILENSVSQNRLKHAYLLCGPRGVGKTTLARVFAQAINKVEDAPQASLDIVEMDAASNTSIDDIRTLKESATTPPMAGAYKIFIIDEVHMLSKPAMNALLKVLEEPPAYLIFLLATTNPEKLLDTVKSRVTTLALSPHSVPDLISRLTFIADRESVVIDEAALHLIAQRSSGSQRDAINMLETVASYGFDTLDISVVTQLLGLVPVEVLLRVAEWMSADETAPEYHTNTIEIIELLRTSGVDAAQFVDQLLAFLLESSLMGQYQYDESIAALSALVQQRLPVQEPSLLIALLGSVVRAQRVAESAPRLETQKIMPTSEPVAVQRPPKDEPHPTQTSQSPSAIPPLPAGHSVIRDIQKMPGAPTMIRLITDLSAHHEGTTLYLHTENKMFAATLGTPSITDWIKEAFATKSGLPVEMVLINAVSSSVPASSLPTASRSGAATLIAKLAPAAPSPVYKKVEKDTIFYETYHHSPGNLTEKNIPVFQGSIIPPEKPVGDGQKSFDEHAEELFEFE
jgi:DNA polymerase III subunit gamma/tau